MIPTPGRIVLYTLPNREVVPAVVTEVPSEQTIGLHVLDTNRYAVMEEVKPGVIPNTWSWPPREN